jgi:hypothetical protein
MIVRLFCPRFHHHRSSHPSSVQDHMNDVRSLPVRALSFTSHCQWASPPCSSCLCHARAIRDPRSVVFIHLEAAWPPRRQAPSLNWPLLRWEPPSHYCHQGVGVATCSLSFGDGFAVDLVADGVPSSCWAPHHARWPCSDVETPRRACREHADHALAPWAAQGQWTRPALWTHVHNDVFHFPIRFSYRIQIKFNLCLNLFKFGSNLVFGWIFSQALNSNRKFDFGCNSIKFI